jgi:hypothetical protein
VPEGDIRAKLIVTDTGPLITLAAADVLDYLLYPGVPVYIPDAVLYEATVNSRTKYTKWPKMPGVMRRD